MASLLDLAQARLQGLLDIPTRVGRAVVNPTLFSGLLGAPTLPKETGMAQAAYGLPAQPNMSVLDPEQRAYLEGYAQGEPYSYLGMAAPFAAPAVTAGTKAVAPKAGMALENYMASQGLLQPLTAYHGTPHTIRGQFDISKVGTGEGAQAYGHGMYFAENPKVAEMYKNQLSSVDGLTKEFELFGKPWKDNTGLQNISAKFVQESGGDVNQALQKFNILKENNKKSGIYTQQEIDEAESLIKNLKIKNELGNLYKVDISDEYIPNMLDWDKPLSQQPNVLQAIQNLSARTDLPKGFDKAIERVLQDKFFDGQDLYYELTKVYKDPAKLSQILKESGFTGIRYLDEGSRSSGKGTSNFVVFDPTDVKILEKNSQKVEGLLD